MITTIPEPEVDLLATELAKQQSKSQNPRRNGKIARLPKNIRDMLNHMLDDGLPYHVIIDELGDAGRGLNTQNITNWVQGGYQDYLKHLEAIDRAKALVEAVVELLQQTGDADLAQIRRACNYVASLQLFEAMRDHGDETLKRLFQASPSKYLNIVHALCHQSNASLKVEKYRFQQQLQAARAGLVPPSSQIKPNQAPGENSANCNNRPVQQPGGAPAASVAPSSQIKPNQAPEESQANCNNPPIQHPTSAPTVSVASSSQIKPNQAPAENPTNCNNPHHADPPIRFHASRITHHASPTVSPRENPANCNDLSIH